MGKSWTVNEHYGCNWILIWKKKYVIERMFYANSIQFPDKDIFTYGNSKSPARKPGKRHAQPRSNDTLLTNP